MKKKLIITGSNGFIGSFLLKQLKKDYNLFGADLGEKINESNNFEHCNIDISSYSSCEEFIDSINPDIIIHCAGIAHQKLGGADKDTYFKVNSEATLNLADAAAKINPDVHFVFLSSISVYGENFSDEKPVLEESDLNPSSDYAKSKLDAEIKLIDLYKNGVLKKLDILRLAPVYDSDWTLNLDKRVFGPKELCYLKFGSGKQKLSAVSRKNLVDFIEYRVKNAGLEEDEFLNIFNVCDLNPYSFKEIINIFKKSDLKPERPVFRVPLSFIWIVTRLAGMVIKSKRSWIYSCYDKVAKDLVFDNTKMLETGFKPEKNLEDIFLK
jgi:nucleoside-diphosphate-sugar epimerase